MPRKQSPESAETIALNQILDEDSAALERVSQEMGPPHGSRKQSEADAVRRWGQLDPRVDPDTLADRLLNEGLPQEEAMELAVLQEYPELLPHFLQPIGDPAMADLLARFAEFPYRWGLLEGIDDPEERATEAERLERLWNKDIERRTALSGSFRSALSGVRGLMQGADSASTPAPVPIVQPLPGPAQVAPQAAGPPPAAGLPQAVGQPPAALPFGLGG